MKCPSRHNLFGIASNDKLQLGAKESLRMFKEAGFEAIDMGFGGVKGKMIPDLKSPGLRRSFIWRWNVP